MRTGIQSLGRALSTRGRRLHIALESQPKVPPFDRATVRPRLIRILTENVIPFWDGRVVDSEGGYRETFDHSGAFIQSDAKHALTQARTLWFFSRLSRTGYAKPGFEAAAYHGFDYLRHKLWDSKRGGVFTDVPSSGNPTPFKHFYDQVMALDAMTEFQLVTASEEARRLVHDLIDVIESRFRDDGMGYVEGLTEAWTLPSSDAGLLVNDPTSKTISTHLNALHVLSVVHSLGLADLAAQIRELLELVDVKAVLPRSRLMGETFTRDWSLVVDSPTVSYGHELERVWMASEARRVIEAEEFPYGTVLDEAVRWGWDRRRGGFYFGGPPGAPARDLRKQWWVQAEALVACSVLRSHSPSDRVGGLLESTLGWIENNQADWEGGEWHDTIDVLGRPSAEKGWTWKTGYHTVRSLLRTLDALPSTN